MFCDKQGWEESLFWNVRRNARRWMAQQGSSQGKTRARGTVREDKRQVFPPRMRKQKDTPHLKNTCFQNIPAFDALGHSPGFWTQTGTLSSPTPSSHHPASWRSPSCLRDISRCQGAWEERKREGEELGKQSERAGANPYGGGLPHEPWRSSKSDGNEMLQGLTQKTAPHSTRLRLPTGEIRNHAQASRYPSGTLNWGWPWHSSSRTATRGWNRRRRCAPFLHNVRVRLQTWRPFTNS